MNITERSKNQQSTTALETRIAARVSKKDALEMKQQAEVSRLTLSEYIRRQVLGKRIVPQSDMNMLAELRRLGGLLKHTHNESRGVYSELTASAIRDLGACARTLERTLREKNRGNGDIDTSSDPEP